MRVLISGVEVAGPADVASGTLAAGAADGDAVGCGSGDGVAVGCAAVDVCTPVGDWAVPVAVSAPAAGDAAGDPAAGAAVCVAAAPCAAGCAVADDPAGAAASFVVLDCGGVVGCAGAGVELG